MKPDESVANFVFFSFFKVLGIGPITLDAIGFPCLFIKLTAFD